MIVLVFILVYYKSLIVINSYKRVNFHVIMLQNIIFAHAINDSPKYNMLYCSLRNLLSGESIENVEYINQIQPEIPVTYIAY